MKNRIVSYNLIKKSAKKVAKKLHPQKIILFGSYSHGKPTNDSDVDLLFIFSKPLNASHTYTEISKILEPREFPIDIMIRSTQQIQSRLKIGDNFIQDILKTGKILYGS